MALVVGIDVGGTFTDLIAVGGGETRIAKVPTTVENQAFGVLHAIEAAGLALADVAAIVHGTTATTNALLERKIARVGLITTKGFRDVLELGRRTRPKPYGMTGHFEPLVPRELRLEVAERMDADGEVVRPLDEAGVATAAKALIAAGCEAIVIHFLHAYRNPAHEKRAVEIVESLWPDGHVTAGHAVLSEYREYERGVTAMVNAAIQPVLHRYIARLRGELAARGFARDLLVMQGNGGTVAAGLVAESAVNTVMSGPASGVMAAARVATAAGFPNVITYDMGGTSSDVGLIMGGLPSLSAELELEYAMPIHVPMVDVHTIGAGGGSIAHLNEAGLLQVGPESAGAVPGPIAYGRGGTRPTITDANLVLGRLNPDGLLAVGRKVTVAHVRDRLAAEPGATLGLDAEATAAAILRIANDRMAGAIRMVSLARGHDPRDFALFAFGGAGPLHAVALARELGIPHVLIPARPGITNALGCVVADLRHDFVRTVNQPLPELDESLARGILAEQVAEGRALLQREAVPIEGVRVVHRADMQFQGQSHILSVDLADATVTRAGLAEAFASAYWRRFEVELAELRPVLVNLHTAVIGLRPAVDLERLIEAGASLEAAQTGLREVWFEGGFVTTPIYRRERMPRAARFDGPAIVEQLDATTVVEPGCRVEIDRLGNLLITV
ncbi:hydantoinase/oxoprolinase family protein [Desertibaculum subflavum]|uniref:hydantoinase/oxoprolinase family protein n=1 Tax=Desertibaculum subflavum TaxID=2268458 RepID=UPI000E671743